MVLILSSDNENPHILSTIDNRDPKRLKQVKKRWGTGFQYIRVSSVITMVQTLLKSKIPIPEEFHRQTQKGPAIIFWEGSSGITQNKKSERLGFLLTPTDKPLFINLNWKYNTKDQKFFQEDWQFFTYPEFASKLLPLQKAWLYRSYWHLKELLPLVLTESDDILKFITKSRNAEVSRVLLKRLGLNNLLDNKNVKVIDREGTSILFDMEVPNWRGDLDTIRLVKVKDRSSDREFILQVDAEEEEWKKDGFENDYKIDTCLKAIAWTYGLRGWEYKPLMGT